jgi:hypothetical protein
VKGRHADARDVIVTKNEILASLNAPETFILAIVQVESGFAQEPMYIRQFANREPGWSEAGVIFNLASLLSIGSPPGWEEGKVATTAELLETVASTIADYREARSAALMQRTWSCGWRSSQ